MEKRQRNYALKNFRLDSIEGQPQMFRGYASLFNVLSVELYPGVREKIAPGAFSEALAKSDVTANWNHNDNFLLARTSSGTLKLTEDELGLYFEFSDPGTSYSNDMKALMQRGDLKECSFAFLVDPKDITVEAVSDTESVETIHRVVELLDVTICTRGAYPQTISAFRKKADLDSTNLETHESKRGDETSRDEEHTFKSLIDVEVARLELTAKQFDY